MPESAFTRFWNTVKPSAPTGTRPYVSPEVLALRRRQRKLVTITLAVLVAVAAAAGGYLFIASAPQRGDKEFQEGMKLMSPGRYPDAVSHFTRALAIYPQLAEAHLERGNANRILGEVDAALADYQAAADLNPTLAEAQNGIAMIYLDRHDIRHALEGFSKSIAMQPTVDAYFQRGQILETQGNHQKAIDDYDRAIAERRDAPFMYRARALARANLGDLDGAHADRAIAEQIEHH